MTAIARSFAFSLWVTAILAACASSYIDQTSALVVTIRIYAYVAGGLGGLLIILTLPGMAAPARMPAAAKAPPEAVRRALAQSRGAPMVRLKPRRTVKPAASADTPDVLRARARRLFGSVA